MARTFGFGPSHGNWLTQVAGDLSNRVAHSYIMGFLVRRGSLITCGLSCCRWLARRALGFLNPLGSLLHDGMSQQFWLTLARNSWFITGGVATRSVWVVSALLARSVGLV